MSTGMLDYTSPHRAVVVERVGDAVQIVRRPVVASDRMGWPAYILCVALGAAAGLCAVFLVIVATLWCGLVLRNEDSAGGAIVRLFKYRAQVVADFGLVALRLWATAALVGLPVAILARLLHGDGWCIRLCDAGEFERRIRPEAEPLQQYEASRIKQVKAAGATVVVRIAKPRVHEPLAERIRCPTRESAAAVAAVILEWVERSQRDGGSD